jgi:Rrf2 family protein
MISQTTEYALRAMACLAIKPDELVSTPALARQTHVPINYLAKVLQRLATADLIQGRRGVGGGYQLARAPGEIHLLDVVNAMDRIKRVESCPMGGAEQGPTLCALHRKIDEAMASFIRVLQSATLVDVVADGRKAPLCEGVRHKR